MAVTNDVSTLTPLFTEAYASGLQTLVRDNAKLLKRIPFVEKEKQVGNLYHQPVVLGLEHGVIFNTDGSAFSLADPGPIAGTYADAQIRGTEICLPSRLSYAAAARALGGVKSFENETRHLVEQNGKSMAFHQELSLIYGQTSIAETSAVTASGTTGTFTVTEASWTAGIWLNAYGMNVDLYDAIDDANPINTTAAVVITSFVPSTRVVSFTCNSSDAAALEAAGTAFVFRRRANAGSGTFRECAGLDAILSNTGTLFNISAATYPLWKSQTQSCSNASLTMSLIQQGMSQCAIAGLDKDVVLLCNPLTWADVMTDLAALRAFDYSYTSEKSENGARNIVYHTQTGALEFMAHPLVKQGEAFAFPLDEFMRVGSTDVTYTMPGMPSEQLLLQLPSNAGYEFRSYSDQALFCKSPVTCLKFTGIVNTF